MTAPVTVRPLLAADPALPHRDTLLDPGPSRRRLAWAAASDDVRPLRVRYQPGRSLRVTQVLAGVPSADAGAAPGAPVLVSTRGVPADRFDRLAETSGAAPGGPVVADPATSSVSWLFPHDRRLTTLPDVWHRTGATRTAVGRRWTSSELVALSPEKAATVRCLGADGQVLAYVKVYPTPDAARDAADRLGAAAALTGLGHGAGSRAARAPASVGARVAAPVAVPVADPDTSPDRRRVVAPVVLALCAADQAVVLQPVAGTPLSDLEADALPGGLAALGTSLGHLHGLPPAGLPPLRRFAPASLHAAAEAVVCARPDLAATAVELASHLVAGEPAAPSSLVHGDAQLPNALLTAAGVVLVDFDEAAAGHRAVDVAGVLAALRRAVLLGTLAPDRETVLAQRFTAAYADVAGAPDEDALRWHTAAALLVGGAARAVRRVQGPSLQRLDVLLHHALDLAHGHATLPGEPAPDPRRTP